MPTTPGDDQWMRQAACRGAPADLWFSERGESTSEGIAVCEGCPVKAACLEYALSHGQHWGTWGGMTARARTKLRRNARKDAA
jgi:WhiB family redox-sensing transcriptional regulator